MYIHEAEKKKAVPCRELRGFLFAVRRKNKAQATSVREVKSGENHYFFQWEGICVTGPSLALGRRMESFRKERRI